MKKNFAGQVVSGQLNNIADGLPFTGQARVAITGDNGVQDITPGGGATVHKGRGVHSYTPTQVETNFNNIVFTFDDAGALSMAASTQIYTRITNFNSGLALGPGVGPNQIQLAATASAIDGLYDPNDIVIISGTGEGQTRGIIEYDGSGKVCTVDRNWKIAPDATSEYAILASSGGQHVNEGLAQGGTANTVTLNAAASDFDDAYNGQTVFIRSGNADDESRIVIGYIGSTKVATVHRAWEIVPDSTSGYVMLPVGGDPEEEVDISQSAADKVWLSADRQLTAFTIGLAVSVWDVLKSSIFGANTIGLLVKNELEISEQLRLTGTATGIPITTQMNTDIIFTDNDQFKGRVIIFENDTISAELRGQVTDILSGTAAGGTLVFTTLTAAPVAGDTFTIS